MGVVASQGAIHPTAYTTSFSKQHDVIAAWLLRLVSQQIFGMPVVLKSKQFGTSWTGADHD